MIVLIFGYLCVLATLATAILWTIGNNINAMRQMYERDRRG